MKTIITYKSKYGSTKQYAEWLAEELNCKAVDISKVKAAKLRNTILLSTAGDCMQADFRGFHIIKRILRLLRGRNSSSTRLALISITRRLLQS